MHKNTEVSDFLTIIRNIPGLDADYAIEMIGSSEELYKVLLQRFVRLLPAYINDMDSAIPADEWDVFAIKVHGVKGSLHQIGNMPLVKSGEALEEAAKANNSAYCHRHYGDFKDGLLCFFSHITSALETLGNRADAEENRPAGNIYEYSETFKLVKNALENYDSLLASEILAPLTEISFGKMEDDLLTKSVEALELFQSQKALLHIMELIKLTHS